MKTSQYPHLLSRDIVNDGDEADVRLQQGIASYKLAGRMIQRNSFKCLTR